MQSNSVETNMLPDDCHKFQINYVYRLIQCDRVDKHESTNNIMSSLKRLQMNRIELIIFFGSSTKGKLGTGFIDKIYINKTNLIWIRRF